MGDYSDGYASNLDSSSITICNKEPNFENCIICIRENYRRGITCTKLVRTKGFRQIIYSKEWTKVINKQEKK